MTSNARLTAAIVALIAAGALVAQFIVSTRLTGNPLITLWVIAGYFTVLTNTMVFATFTLMAIRNRRASATWLAGLTLWIVIVGAVYHTLLARIWSPTGLAWWADQGLHTVVPLATLVWWQTMAPRVALAWRNAVQWLAWPLAYTTYAMIRGLATGAYPYPFIDLSVLTPTQVLVNSIGLCVAFWIGGLVIIAIARARAG